MISTRKKPFECGRIVGGRSKLLWRRAESLLCQKAIETAWTYQRLAASGSFPGLTEAQRSARLIGRRRALCWRGSLVQYHGLEVGCRRGDVPSLQADRPLFQLVRCRARHRCWRGFRSPGFLPVTRHDPATRGAPPW